MKNELKPFMMIHACSVPALGRLRQEDYHEFKAIVGRGPQSETLSLKRKVGEGEQPEDVLIYHS